MGMEQTFNETVSTGKVTLEEGTIISRTKQNFEYPTDLQAAKVNGPKTDKGQYIWMGTYSVKLDRGLALDAVMHVTGIGGSGVNNTRGLVIGDRVVVSWLNKANNQIPVIIDGDTMEFYNKLIVGHGHLIDQGEQVIRSAIAKSPGADGDYPFANNQYDNPNSTEGDKQDASKVVSLPGAETFYDKFGRIIEISRTTGTEFLITTGKTDTGQDDISTLTTVSAQDNYYSAISNDESRPLLATEPFAPKILNTKQYQLTNVLVSIEGDPDPKRTTTVGILPRFDKWKFQPIVIRKYGADSDGVVESPNTYTVRQERGQSKADAPGYVRSITDKGDIKEFIPRHYNGRIVKDYLVSIGGNYELKVKTTDRKSDGSSNLTNLVHQEFLADGTVRMRVNETSSTKATFDYKTSPDGTTELYIKDGGGSASSHNFKLKILPDGTLDIESEKAVTIKAKTAQITGGTLTVNGSVTPTAIGGPFCGIKNCLFSGAPHTGSEVSNT